MRLGIQALRWAGAVFGLLVAGGPVTAQVIRSLPTEDKVVALTFDACEAGKPTVVDNGITGILAAERIPYTIFVSGRFARSHAGEVAELARSEMVEIENHSFNHPLHMETLSAERVAQEVAATESLLLQITGRRTRFFRFPGGNYDARTLAHVQALGYRVVHWGLASGDPDPGMSAARLTTRILANTHNGSIHIFHINGRGVHTGEALPRIIEGLRQRGYRFVRLDDVLKPAAP